MTLVFFFQLWRKECKNFKVNTFPFSLLKLLVIACFIFQITHTHIRAASDWTILHSFSILKECNFFILFSSVLGSQAKNKNIVYFHFVQFLCFYFTFLTLSLFLFFHFFFSLLWWTWMRSIIQRFSSNSLMMWIYFRGLIFPF